MTRGHENDGSERKCVVGQANGPIRSGEFIIGGQLGGATAPQAGRSSKVWWAPLHNAEGMPPLVIRGTSLTGPGDTVRITLANVAHTQREAGAPKDAPREYFFPSGLVIPRPGRWLLVATSGANWGCFILTALSRGY